MSPRQASTWTSCSTAAPAAMPTVPIRIELSTWPTPQAAVMAAVRVSLQARALDNATNGR